MTSPLAGKSAAVVGLASVVIFGAVIAALSWLPDTVVQTAAVLGIIWGTVMIDRAIMNEERQRSDVASSKLLIVLRAAIILSAVSFATTLFGMLNFVAGSGGSENTGQKVIGWFISLGTTFGIQFIMLVISLVLGERLIHMRPRFDDKLHRNLSEIEEVNTPPRHLRLKQATMIPLAALLLFAASLAFGFISVNDLWTMVTDLKDKARPQIGLGIMLVIAALIVLRSARVMTSLWQPVTLLFLFFVYTGTLAVSSLFSFDSYYGILQTESDLAQRKGSIVREETGQMFITARNSLDEEMARIREGDRSEQLDALVRDGIDTLVRNARELEEEFIRDAQLKQESKAERNERIDAQIAQLRQDKARDVAAALDVVSQAETLQAEVDRLEAETETARQAVDTAIGARDTVQTDINNLRAWADCEEQGLTEGICATAPVPVRLPECKARCLGYRRDADTKERIDLPAAERDIETARQNLRDAENAVQSVKVELDAVRDQITAAEGEVSSAALNARTVAKRYDDQIEILIAQKDLSIVEVEDTEFDVASLSAAYAAFKSNPNTETLAVYDDVCRTTRDTLLALNVQDATVREFDCQPAVMSVLASSASRVQRSQARFDTDCAVGQEATQTDAAGQTSQSAANDDASLRAVVDRTRACLAIANVGQQPIITASQTLTELESTYLSDSPRIRRAVEDLKRGNVFALGAAAAAVFIDVLILVVGLLVAMSRDSVLYDNPLDPGVAAVEEMISRTAAWYAPDRREATGMRIFYQYLEPRYVDGDEELGGSTSDEIYRAVISLPSVPPQNRPLVTAMIHALPARYKRTVAFRPIDSGGKGDAVTATAINGTIVSFISRKAHVAGPDDDGTVDYAQDRFASNVRGIRSIRRDRDGTGQTDMRSTKGHALDDDLDDGKIM